MNKSNLFLLFILITYSNCDTRCREISNPTSKSDCNGKLSQTDKDNKYAYCCFESYSKKSEYNSCTAIDQKKYDNMDKYAKIYKKQQEINEIMREIYPDEKEYEDYGEYSIDCNSNYLKTAMIALVLLFLI